jgi:hypothetical protein
MPDISTKPNFEIFQKKFNKRRRGVHISLRGESPQQDQGEAAPAAV